MRKAYSYIRMSTETQLKGDSLRRQLEGSENYARKNDLELVDSIDGIPLKDLGVSAFNGKNTQKGALSIFLAALDQGKIEPNSVLLIESLDRLSRDRLSEALPQFLSILNSGIEIVTLTDNQKYTKDIINKDYGSLFVSLGVMVRANEESLTKSKRLRAAWANKRLNSASKVLTTLCPAWLQYSENTKSFEFVNERKKVVELIFDMCINSGGLYSIARYFNENHIPVFGKGKIWHRSYIKKIINNRSVVGEFQPHEMVDGKRQKSGDPIANYFPKVIDENRFLLAQVAITRRTNLGKGRKGSFFSNLFAGITYCGHCQFKMVVRNHGGTLRGAKCLVCTNKNLRGGCENGEWNLADFDSIIFPHLNELNFDDLIENNTDTREISLNDKYDLLLAKLQSKKIEFERTMELIASPDFIDDVKVRFQKNINSLQVDIDSLNFNINELVVQISDEKTSRDIKNPMKLKELLAKIEDHKDDYIFRSSVNQLLIRMIEKIELIESSEEFMPWEFDEESYEVKNFRQTFPIRLNRALDEILGSSDFKQFCKKQQRQIKITYKTGAVRRVLCGHNISFGRYDRH